MTDSDIQRTAWEVLEKHGDRAHILAAIEADACLEAGDLDGVATWRLVLRAIRGMMEPEGVAH